MTDDYDTLFCRVHDFVTAELEGEATESERQEFAELINSDRRARRIYVEYIQELTSLRWSYSASHEDFEETISPAVLQGMASRLDDGSAVSPSPSGRERRGRFTWRWMTLAASLLIGLGWASAWWSGLTAPAGPAPEGRSIGRVVALDNVQWPDGHGDYGELSQVPSGEAICFESGVMDLMLNSGARILIEGPADFCFESTKKAFVRKGKLVIRCGPDAVGFEVESPDASVVDLGTVFGVSVVDKDRTDVVVYDGAVDLSPRGLNKIPARRLTAGEALHVSRHGAVGRITVVPNDRLLMPRSMTERSGDRPVLISEVRDNLQSSETAKYYRIVGGGFGEDCSAYVDRDHQWNGIDTKGLPPFLLGGDYVMTFNDDKVRRITMEIDLEAPASVYMLLDNRVAAPDWLVKDFTDTGWDVGLDEKYDDREGYAIGKGPGESIDQMFSVWRMDCPEATTVRLFPMRPRDLNVDPRTIEECMYGIVVTELDEAPEPPGI